MFRILFPKSVMDICIEETNRFAEQSLNSSRLANSTTRRQKNWKPVVEDEFLKFIAIRILMGITNKPEQRHY